MQQVKELLGYAMRYPFLLKLEHNAFIKVQTGVTDDGKPIFANVIKNGIMDVVSNPKDPISMGDLVRGYGLVLYTVKSVIQTRVAKGESKNIEFIPVWQRLEVEFSAVAQ